MRLLLDARPYFAGKSGLGRHIAGYVGALRKKAIGGCEIFLLSTNNFVLLTDSSVSRPIPALLAQLPKPIWEQCSIPFTCRQLRADAYHIFHEGGPRYRASWRFVVNLYDLIPLKFPDWYLTGPLRRKYYEFKLKTVSRYADAIVTCSSSSLEDLRNFLKISEDRLHLIPTPADEMFKPLPEDKRRLALDKRGLRGDYMVSVGSAEPRKNLKVVLAAYKTLVDRRITVPPLVLYGGPWRGRLVLELVKEYKLTDYVIDLGLVTDDELVALYSGARAFLYLSLYEGYGLPVLEAMACGCPVIASNTSSIPEVAGNAARLVNPKDSRALAEEIIRLAYDQKTYADLRLRGLVRAAELSWSNVVDRTMPLYSS